ncbi:MAG: hypothetical protein F6K58_32205 [Symploca sp. SIO2E9]|nr:hypothetical protein [Symploca sp. SIO2E9]
MSDLTISSSDLTNSSSGLTNPPTEALTNSQQPPQEDLTPVATVFKNLGISRDTGYKRMSRLQIKPVKIKNKSFLNPVQIAHDEMDFLRGHSCEHFTDG